MRKKEHQKNVEILLTRIEEADAILVGAGSGMSASDGHVHYYERDGVFEKWFGEFEKKYGYHGTFKGVYYPYNTREEYWAYMAQLITLIRSSKAGQPYQDIKRLLKDKNYHILTTNQDTLFTQICPEEKISAIQGDWRYIQCKNRCHDAVYDNEKLIKRIVEATENCTIPSDVLPRCPKCGGQMEPWVRGYDFLEGRKYKEEYEKLNKFLEKNMDKNILFLELGVGRMTPMFIQRPFWNLTYKLPNAFYITINPKDALLPGELEKKGVAIKEDIAVVLKDTAALKNMVTLQKNCGKA